MLLLTANLLSMVYINKRQRINKHEKIDSEGFDQRFDSVLCVFGILPRKHWIAPGFHNNKNGKDKQSKDSDCDKRVNCQSSDGLHDL